MPPIPKFAKALAKLAKANPKVIERDEPSKKDINNQSEKANTLEKTMQNQVEIKKFAKDDMEIDKIRREKAKKELEQRLPKKAKDDQEILKNSIRIQKKKIVKYFNLINGLTLDRNRVSLDLVSKMDKIKNTNLDDLKQDNVNGFLKNIKTFFESVDYELESSNPFVSLIKEIIGIIKNLDLKDNSAIEESIVKVKTIVKQLR